MYGEGNGKVYQVLIELRCPALGLKDQLYSERLTERTQALVELIFDPSQDHNFAGTNIHCYGMLWLERKSDRSVWSGDCKRYLNE